MGGVGAREASCLPLTRMFTKNRLYIHSLRTVHLLELAYILSLHSFIHSFVHSYSLFSSIIQIIFLSALLCVLRKQEAVWGRGVVGTHNKNT